MTADVLVIGAGAAGTGAALTAALAGASVTVVDGAAGATILATGALDLVAWTRPPASGVHLAPAAKAALDALGAYVLPDRGALLLTTAGVIRPATGHDAALLDVASCAGRRVGVVRCARPGWDADVLARAWGDAYEPISVPALRYSDERVIPDADFAQRHDDDARLDWLSERLREAMTRAGGEWAALVLPPALGVERARADALSRSSGARCGEALAMPGGPSGLRFGRARDRALASSGVERIQARATAAAHAGDVWRVSTEDGRTIEARSVVLATGGLLGGGLEYSPSEAMHATALPPCSRPPFRLTVDIPLVLGAHGRPLDLPSSLFGMAPESLAWPFSRDPLIERVGVLVGPEGAGHGAPTAAFAAGDVVADAPRTWLAALSSGARAGAAAALAAVHGRVKRAGGLVNPMR